MSIRQFGAEELGNLVSLIANGMVSPGTREPAAEQLHHVSVANTWAYNKQYRQRAEPAASAFDGPDVVNLPAGNTLWRASNAISWIANAESVAAERRLELQELAGQLLPSS
jgi:hypothetical protein